MEPLIVTTDGVWREVEVLQWMERNTQLFTEAPPVHSYVNYWALAGGGTALDYTVPLKTNYKSQRRIAELVGKVVYR